MQKQFRGGVGSCMSALEGSLGEPRGVSPVSGIELWAAPQCCVYYLRGPDSVPGSSQLYLHCPPHLGYPRAAQYIPQPFFLAYISQSPVAQLVKNLPAMQKTWVRSLGREDPLEKEMATHSSILAWRTPGTEEPGRLHTVHGIAKSQTRLKQLSFTFSSVQLLSHVSLQPHGLQHTRPPCPSPTPRVHPNPCPLSW